jgi:hypothetical protein
MGRWPSGLPTPRCPCSLIPDSAGAAPLRQAKSQSTGWDETSAGIKIALMLGRITDKKNLSIAPTIAFCFRFGCRRVAPAKPDSLSAHRVLRIIGRSSRCMSCHPRRTLMVLSQRDGHRKVFNKSKRGEYACEFSSRGQCLFYLPSLWQ